MMNKDMVEGKTSMRYEEITNQAAINLDHSDDSVTLEIKLS